MNFTVDSSKFENCYSKKFLRFLDLLKRSSKQISKANTLVLKIFIKYSVFPGISTNFDRNIERNTPFFVHDLK